MTTVTATTSTSTTETATTVTATTVTATTATQTTMTATTVTETTATVTTETSTVTTVTTTTTTMTTTTTTICRGDDVCVCYSRGCYGCDGEPYLDDVLDCRTETELVYTLPSKAYAPMVWLAMAAVAATLR